MRVFTNLPESCAFFYLKLLVFWTWSEYVCVILVLHRIIDFFFTFFGVFVLVSFLFQEFCVGGWAADFVCETLS